MRFLYISPRSIEMTIRHMHYPFWRSLSKRVGENGKIRFIASNAASAFKTSATMTVGLHFVGCSSIIDRNLLSGRCLGSCLNASQKDEGTSPLVGHVGNDPAALWQTANRQLANEQTSSREVSSRNKQSAPNRSIS